MKVAEKSLPVMMITLETDGCHRCLFVDYGPKVTCRLVNGTGRVQIVKPSSDYVARPDWCPLFGSNVFVTKIRRPVALAKASVGQQ